MGKAITPLCIRMTNHKFDIFDQILKDLFHNMPKKRKKLKIVITIFNFTILQELIALNSSKNQHKLRNT